MLSVRGLDLVYASSRGPVQALQQLDFDVEAGAFVSVLGPSGCGKSTLLKLASGLLRPTAGSISLSGKVIEGPRPEVGIVFQQPTLLPWKTVLDNVALGLDHGLHAAAGALAAVGLADRADAWPAQLSGGQRQRVALARALVHEPALLLLDEPLGALDALTRIEMQGLIESLWRQRGFTAVLVTHDVQEAVALADRVLLIEAGRITLDLAIDLPRPRARDAAFAALEGELLARLLGR
jgi:sulfonate transport system ATP-binding protein